MGMSEDYITQSTEAWGVSLLSMPWGPESAHTKGEKQGKRKTTNKEQIHMVVKIQIQACLLTLFSEQKSYTHTSVAK